MGHKVYSFIIKAIENGTLAEPFSIKDFKQNCPRLGDGTYKAFLYKHKVGNKGGNPELFTKIGRNKFVMVRPFLYGF